MFERQIWYEPIAHDRSPGQTSGDEGIRTPDIRVANAALYQLSYVPEVPVAAFRSLVSGILDQDDAFAHQRFH